MPLMGIEPATHTCALIRNQTMTSWFMVDAQPLATAAGLHYIFEEYSWIIVGLWVIISLPKL